MNMNDIPFQYVWLICIKTVSLQHEVQSSTRRRSAEAMTAVTLKAQELDASCPSYRRGRKMTFQLPAFMFIMTHIQPLM